MYIRFFKRLLDFAIAATSLFVLFVPMLLVAIVTKLDSSGSPFFLQRRSGKGKQEFTIYKFRSMPEHTPKDIPTSRMEFNGMTRWQQWIRMASIDELPQLLNILMGDMSLVGPRPVICEEQDLIGERDKYGANDVRPGLTGWAQINGRDDLDFVTKARLDGEYVQKMGFLFDMKCIWFTFFKVLKQDGIKH